MEVRVCFSQVNWHERSFGQFITPSLFNSAAPSLPLSHTGTFMLPNKSARKIRVILNTYSQETYILLRGGVKPLELYFCWCLISIYPDKACWVCTLERLLSLQQPASLPIHEHTHTQADTYIHIWVLMLANEQRRWRPARPAAILSQIEFDRFVLVHSFICRELQMHTNTWITHPAQTHMNTNTRPRNYQDEEREMKKKRKVADRFFIHIQYLKIPVFQTERLTGTLTTGILQEMYKVLYVIINAQTSSLKIL